MAESCLLSLPSLFCNKIKYPFLSNPSKPLKLQVAYSNSSLFSPSLSLSISRRTHHSSILTFVAQTSGWAQQEDNTVAIEEGEAEEDEPAWENQDEPAWENQDEPAWENQDEPTWENQDVDGTEARVSDWDPNSEDAVTEGSEGEEEGGEDGLFEERDFAEPPEDAKIFVGNLPFDVDSQKLAMLFEKAGTVEIAEVIYNRETDQSRGFGFVTMRTVEEAEKAVEKFSRYDLNGRLLTVNKAAPRGTQPENLPRAFEPALRIYVGNLPWGVDNARLEQVFSEHGNVVNARVVYDRETGRSRGFGFVTMSSETEMNDAIAALDGQNLDGRTIRVNVAEDRPRRSPF